MPGSKITEFWIFFLKNVDNGQGKTDSGGMLTFDHKATYYGMSPCITTAYEGKLFFLFLIAWHLLLAPGC